MAAQNHTSDEHETRKNNKELHDFSGLVRNNQVPRAPELCVFFVLHTFLFFN